MPAPMETPTAPEAPAEAPDGATTLNYNTESFEVDGIHVIQKRTPGNAIVDVRVFIDGGSGEVPAALGGRDALALDVAFAGGPASMEKNAYTAAVEAMGAGMGGGLDYDFATVSLGSIAPYFEDVWDIFAQVIAEPAFREGDLELRRELTLTDLRTEQDDPDSAVSIEAKRIAFAGSRYESRPVGTEASVAALTTDDLRAAWDELWVKSRLTVVVVGNVERSTVERLVSDTFGGLPEGDFALPESDALSFDAPTLTVTARPELPTNYILGYFAAPPVTHPDYPALQAALSILSDRLFESVRTERNLSYAVSSGLSDRRLTTGYMYVSAVQPNVTLQVMFDTIDAMVDPLVPESDLQAQIEGYLTGYYSGLQSNGAQASLLGRASLVAGGREEADAHLERLAAVTAEDIARVLTTYVRNIQFAVIGDPSALDEGLFTSR